MRRMQDNENRPHVKPGSIKYTKGFRSRMLATKSINWLIIISLTLVVALAIFVFLKQPVKTEEGYVTVTQKYEFMEHGEKVVIVNDEGYNMFTPLKRFIFNQEVYMAEVIAGPYGEIEHSKGSQRVSDGENIIRVNLESKDDEYLDMEYIVRAIDANGSEIDGLYDEIVTRERILGSIVLQKE